MQGPGFKTHSGRRLLAFGGLAGVAAAIWLTKSGTFTRAVSKLLRWWRGTRTVADRVGEHGDAVRARLAPLFAAAAVRYPPSRIIIAAFKEERRLEMYASNAGGRPQFIRAYPILGASGNIGPKLLEGDRQVPEGTYSIESLNPNSFFHLALRIAYPSPFDREMASRDGRTNLGGDIMIHGGSSSVGCLAVGNQAIEELFVLAAIVGIGRVTVVIAPFDFRRRTDKPRATGAPSWTSELYAKLRVALASLPSPSRN